MQMLSSLVSMPMPSRPVDHPRANPYDDEAVILSLLDKAGIPPRYRTATLKTCRPEFAEYADMIASGHRRNLVIQGEVNTGKTYSACAVLKRFIAATKQRGAFTTFDDLLYRIRDAYGHNESEKMLVNSLTLNRMLVIDDFGKEQMTQWSLPIIWRIVNKRYNDQRPTVFTTQYTSDELVGRMCGNGGDMQMAKAIVRRMVDPLVDGEDSRAVVVKAVGTYAG